MLCAQAWNPGSQHAGEMQVVDVNARVTGFLLGTEDSDTQYFVERVLLALLKSGPHGPVLYGEFLI